MVRIKGHFFIILGNHFSGKTIIQKAKAGRGMIGMLGLMVEKGPVPAVRQLCGQLRHLIGTGMLAAGTKLPSTRELARQLGIARNTAVDVYEQLIAEGFLESRVGSGTYVAEGAGFLAGLVPTAEGTLPERLSNRAAVGGTRDAGRGMPDISAVADGWKGTARGQENGGTRNETSAIQQASGDLTGNAWSADPFATGPYPVHPSAMDVIDFTGGFPDLSRFPRRAWGHHLRESAMEASDWLLGYGDSFGDPVLRGELAGYLFRAKGIRAEPERIAVVSGSSEGFLLIAHAMAGRFNTVVVEDPTVEFGRDIFAKCGYRLKPVDVDRQGIRADRFDRLEPGELMLLTPSHQFPTGSILSIQRRRRLVELAAKAGSYLIEDDYDSEFRFRGSPVPPLLALSPDRVIHVGTFSKTLSPGLRLGFIVIPPDLLGLFRETKEALNLLAPNIEQRALACMLAEGDFERHLYRMVKVYRHKRAALVSALETRFHGAVEVLGDEAGMHLLARIETVRDTDWRMAAPHGVRIQCAGDYRLKGGGERNELVFGYGHLSEEQIREGVARLAAFLGRSG